MKSIRKTSPLDIEKRRFKKSSKPEKEKLKSYVIYTVSKKKSLKMASAEEVELRVNLNSLKKTDPEICEILDSAVQVALYIWDVKENRWEKPEVEGTLFVYRSVKKSYHSAINYSFPNIYYI